jgi:hypothetical protein
MALAHLQSDKEEGDLFFQKSTTMASSSVVNANASANTPGSNALCVIVGMMTGYSSSSNVVNNLAT